MTAGAPEFALDERLLPPQIRRLIRAIGVADTLTVLQALGGTRLTVPKGRLRAQRCRVLQPLIGPAQAKALYAEFAGVKDIHLPKADKMLMQVRNAALKADSRTASVRTLALRYKLTERQVQYILANEDWPAWRKPQPQLDLFEIAGS